MNTTELNKTTKPLVLLVEDEKIVQAVHLAMLKKFHCNVELAQTGQEALSKFNNHYALILMDIGLPDMQGTAVTTKMRGCESDKHTPIVALTAYSQEDIADECTAAGIDAIYNKPLMPDILEHMLQTYGHIDHI